MLAGSGSHIQQQCAHASSCEYHGVVQLLLSRVIANEALFNNVTLLLKMNNFVGDSGACGLGHALKFNTSLQALNLVSRPACELFAIVARATMLTR